MPPAPSSAPVFPVLPGIVGPQVDSAFDAVPGPGPTDVPVLPPTEAAPQQRAYLVPPPAETWDAAVESGALSTGQVKPPAIDGVDGFPAIAVALGLVGVVGVAAMLAFVLKAHRRALRPVPMSILHDRPVGGRRRGEAG